MVSLEQNPYFTAKVTFQFHILTSNCFRLDHKSLMRADNSGVECLEKRDGLTEQWGNVIKINSVSLSVRQGMEYSLLPIADMKMEARGTSFPFRGRVSNGPAWENPRGVGLLKFHPGSWSRNKGNNLRETRPSLHFPRIRIFVLRRRRCLINHATFEHSLKSFGPFGISSTFH